MSWFSRRKEERKADLVQTLSTAFGQALTGVLAAQTEQIKQSSQFLGTLQDLSARKAAQVLGSKGGRTTQKRKKEAKAATAAQQDCGLCVDPNRRDVTLEMLAYHRQHGGTPVPQTQTLDPAEVGN
jgi:hypothetical protein